MTEQYLCKDCKHSFRPIGRILTFGLNSPYAFMCSKSHTDDYTELDKVVGSKLVKGGYKSCGSFRLSVYDGGCGPDAAYWQPKEKRDLFKLIAKE